jgi:hypothetical protein
MDVGIAQHQGEIVRVNGQRPREEGEKGKEAHVDRTVRATERRRLSSL